MGGLGTIDQDVRFDWTAASDLSAEMRATASVLEFQITERNGLAAGAREFWQGRFATEFDDRMRLCTGDASSFASALRDAADQLDELARLAREEQDRRIAAREWVASQNSDDGGMFGGVPVVGEIEEGIRDGLDAAHDAVFGEEVPPELTPTEPPSIPIGEPSVVTREAPPATPVPTYGSGGVSSARPDDLDAWVSASLTQDDTIATHKGSLDDLHASFTGSLGWGSFDASSLVGAIGTWLSYNGTDGEWVATIAQAFRDAGSGTVPDAAITARLDQLGLSTPRVSATFDAPVVWGEMPTSGYANDPVNTASGNFLLTEGDVEGRGLGRLLAFTRTYNSRSDRVGPFGVGWASWASVRLRAEPDGAHWIGPDGQEAVIPRAPAPNGWGRARRSAATGVSAGVTDSGRPDGAEGTGHGGLGSGRPDGAEGTGPGGLDSDRVAYQRVAGVPGLVVAGDDGSEGDGDGDGGGLVLEALDGGSSRLRFDRAGRPVAVDAGPGTEVTFRHDASDRLVEMRHTASGRTLTFRWDRAGDRIAEVACSDGRRTTYGYDGRGYLVTVEGGPQGARRYDVDDRGRVVAVIDADGVVEAANVYDDEGRVVAQTSPHGRRTAFRYLPGHVTVVGDGDRDGDRGPTNSYVHDDQGRLVGAIDGHGNELRKVYDRWGNPTRVVERDGSTTLMSWDDRGRLVRRQAPDGSWFTFAHDGLGRVVEVTASTGAVTRLRYEGDERSPAEIVDPEGGVTRMDVDGGLVRRVVDPDGVVVHFDYDARGQLVAVTDAAGNTAVVERDEAGRVTATVTAMGLRTSYAYDGAGRPVERRDPAGGVWRYEWSAAGRLTATIDPSGARRELRYGAHGEAEQILDELGHVTTRRFDALGNLIGVVLPDGAKWELDYDALCRLTRVTDPAGATWLREYDATGRLVGSVDPVGVHRQAFFDSTRRVVGVDDGLTSARLELDELGRVVAHQRPDGSQAAAEHDRCGRIVAVTDAHGGVTRYAYTPAGRIASVTSPLGHTTRYDYDRCGRCVGVIDPAGHRWAYHYDGDGRVTRVVAPTGETTRFRYDDGGRLVARVAPVASAGGTTRYEYDACGRVVAVTDPAGGVTRYRWDARGQLVEAVDANGGVTRYERDERGLLRTLVDPLGGRVEHRYDAAGRLVEQTDQLGRSTHWEYDAAGRLVRRMLVTGEQVRWSYDSSGRVRAIGTGDGDVVEIERDLLGRPVVVTEPGFRHELEWDGHGRLVAKRRNGLELRWRYDADGRRTAIGYPDGTETTFELDPRGRPTAAHHPALGTVTFAHDAVGRLTERHAPGPGLGPRPGPGLLQRWHYAEGRLVRHETEQVPRDAADRLHGTGEPTGPGARGGAPTPPGAQPGAREASPDRDDAGEGDDASEIGSAEPPGGDDDGRGGPTDRVAGPEIGAGGYGERRRVTELERDAAGRMVAATTDGARTTYRYDAAGQLVGVEGPSGSWAFGYDAAGRLVTETGPTGTATYDYDPAHQLVEHRTRDVETRFAHDRAGRRVAAASSDGHEGQYRWDWMGRLAEIDWATERSDRPSGAEGVTRLTVDALGDLAEVDGLPLLWDPTELVPQLRWLDGTAVVGDHQPWAAVDRDGAVTWLDADWQGTIRTPHDLGVGGGGPGDSPVNRGRAPFDSIDPWGADLGAGDGPGSGARLGLGYRGELDVDGLLWLRNRVYDPATRGFLSTDPLAGLPGVPAATNPYHYAANDPVGAVDPLGLRPMTEADFDAYRQATADSGIADRLGNVAEGVTDWVADNWEYVALGAVLVGATVIGGPIGTSIVLGAALGGGISAGSQYLLTGQVRWDQVAMDAAIGGLAGGTGAAVSSSATAGRVVTTTTGRAILAGGTEGLVSGTAYQGVNYAQTGQFDGTAVVRDTLIGGGSAGLGGRLAGRGPADDLLTPTTPHPDPTPPPTGWTLPEGGGGARIGDRWYTEHALERMAPRTPEVMAELESRGLARAQAQDLEPGTPAFGDWWNRSGPDPRGVPPTVVEAEIANPGSTEVRVITNDQGDVVTVIPRGRPG